MPNSDVLFHQQLLRKTPTQHLIENLISFGDFQHKDDESPQSDEQFFPGGLFFFNEGEMCARSVKEMRLPNSAKSNATTPRQGLSTEEKIAKRKNAKMPYNDSESRTQTQMQSDDNQAHRQSTSEDLPHARKSAPPLPEAHRALHEITTAKRNTHLRRR